MIVYEQTKLDYKILKNSEVKEIIGELCKKHLLPNAMDKFVFTHRRNARALRKIISATSPDIYRPFKYVIITDNRLPKTIKKKTGKRTLRKRAGSRIFSITCRSRVSTKLIREEETKLCIIWYEIDSLTLRPFTCGYANRKNIILRAINFILRRK